MCSILCTAESYDLDGVRNELKKTVTSWMEHEKCLQIDQGLSTFFIFEEGVLVCWGTTKEEEDVMLKNLFQFSKPGDTTERTSETMQIYYDPNARVGMRGDNFILNDIDQGQNMEKLAFSIGLMQSVKLETIENEVDNIIRQEEALETPRTMAQTGKLQLSGKEITMKVGEILLLRGKLNNASMTDTPNICWNKPQLEEIWKQIIRNQEIESRLDRLHQRLTHALELNSYLRNLSTENRTALAEYLIIFLILMELLFNVFAINDFLIATLQPYGLDFLIRKHNE